MRQGISTRGYEAANALEERVLSSDQTFGMDRTVNVELPFPAVSLPARSQVPRRPRSSVERCQEPHAFGGILGEGGDESSKNWRFFSHLRA